VFQSLCHDRVEYLALSKGTRAAAVPDVLPLVYSMRLAQIATQPEKLRKNSLAWHCCQFVISYSYMRGTTVPLICEALCEGIALGPGGSVGK
jgi:hypothetical protein